MVQTIVLPLDAIDLSTLITFCAINESSPDVGSSQNISGGSVNTCKRRANRTVCSAGVVISRRVSKTVETKL